MWVPRGVPAVDRRAAPVAVLRKAPVAIPRGAPLVVLRGAPVAVLRGAPAVVLRGVRMAVLQGAPVVGPQAVNDLRRSSPFVAPRVPPIPNGQQSGPDSRPHPSSSVTRGLGHATDRCG